MAVRLNATGDTLDLTTALPSNTSFTIMLDAQIVADLGSTIQPLVFALNGGFTDGFSLIWEGPADTMMVEAYDAGAVSSNTAFGSRPAVGVPFCAFVRCRGTGTGLYEAGWKYPLGPWVRANATMAGTIAQVATIWFGGVLGAYTADKRIKNIKVWDRALSDGELQRESESESVVFKSGLNCHFPMPHLGDLRDRGPKSKTLARGGTMETEYFNYPRYNAARKLIVATAPTGGALAGSSAQSFTNTATLAGRGALAGACALAFGQSVALAGRGALAGPAALAFTNSATVAGRGAAAGAASIAFTNAGTVLGRGALAGAAAQTFAEAAALTGRGALVGSAALTFANSATFAAAGSISGACALTFASAGTLAGRGALAGSAAQAFTNAGALTGYAPIAGSAAITFANSATLLGGDTLVGTCTITFAIAGTLAGRGQLAGTASLTFANSAAIKMIGPLAGAAALGFTTAGAAAGRGALAGSAAAAFTGQAAMAGRGALAGAAAITFTLQATDNSTGYVPPDHGRVLNIRPESREYLIRAENRTLGIQ